MEEVRFARLRPAQLIERRNACPVVYIPLGTLEWHGLHNPMGADGLQAEELAMRCARLGGGLVFPTVYYGESRANSLLETDPVLHGGVAARLGLTEEQLSPERQPYSLIAQIEHYQRHLTHILSEAASYGFRLAVFVIGHYPLLDHARAAVLTFNQWNYDKPWKPMLAWAFADFQLLKGEYDRPGDHAGAWETSHLLASDPDTVDMKLTEKSLQYGILTTRDPANATADFGNEIFDAAVRAAVGLVHNRLTHPEAYSGHGMPVDL
jgi:creatinine amidohydrolase